MIRAPGRDKLGPGGRVASLFAPVASSGGYTPPAGATNVLTHIKASEYADADSVVDLSENLVGAFTKTGTSPAIGSRGGYGCLELTAANSDGWTHATPAYTSHEDPKTIYVVFEPDSVGPLFALFGITNYPDVAAMRVSSNGLEALWYESAVVYNDYEGPVSSGARHVGVAEFSDSTVKPYLDGTAGSGAACADADLSAASTDIGYLVGYVGQFGQYFDGGIFEIVVDDAPYSSTLNSALMAAYGIS